MRFQARCYPDGFPCVVYLNGAFYGIFSWQLKKHRDNMAMGRNEMPDPVETTVQNAVQDIGLNSPEYWEAVLRNETTASGANIQALMDKYHKAVTEMK